MSVETVEVPGGELLIRIDGHFGAQDAWEVRARMEHLAPPLPLVLDFSQVRGCEDFAIALLAPDLADLGVRCRIRGLGLHQRRILEYFGVEEPAGDHRGDDEAAEARA